MGGVTKSGHRYYYYGARSLKTHSKDGLLGPDSIWTLWVTTFPTSILHDIVQNRVTRRGVASVACMFTLAPCRHIAACWEYARL